MIIFFLFLISSVFCIANPLVEDFDGRHIELNEEEFRNIDALSFVKDSAQKTAVCTRQMSDDSLTIILEKKEGSHRDELLAHFYVIEWTLRVQLKEGRKQKTLFKMFSSSTSPLAFYAYFDYDRKTKDLTLYTLRHEHGQCIPIVYVWKDIQLKSKVKYSTSIFPDNFADSLRCIRRQNCVFYLLKKKNIKPDDSLQFEAKVNIYKHHLEQPAIQMNKVFDVMGIIFPYVPEEFFISKLHPIQAAMYQLNRVKRVTLGNKPEDLMNKKSECIENHLHDFHEYYELSSSAAIYHLVLSELEKEMIEKTQLKEPSDEQLAQFVTELKADVSGYPELSREIDTIITKRLPQKDIRRYYQINDFFKKKYEAFTAETKQASDKKNITVEDFYNTHRDWAFVKIEPPFDKHYSLNHIRRKYALKTFVASEILRLQQIGLQDFIEGKIPVKIEFDIQDKPMALLPQPTGIQRFLTAEDVREILDGGAKSVFNDDELKDLLAEPDPARFTSSMELGMAYDWAGKFAEAKAELEKDTTPLGRFELGRFLMAGRPGIPADRDRANSILEKLVNDMEDRLDREEELSAEECILAGKACHEIRPRRSTQWAHWVELGDEFFQQAIELGERAGHYYIQYYRRTKPGKKLEEMWKALPTNDIEARAGLAAYAGHLQQFRKHLNQEQHLRDLKSAVQARCNRAQYWLGLLYSLNVGTQQGKYLKHSNEKARFWLKRAAERGDQDAQFLLGTMSPQSP